MNDYLKVGEIEYDDNGNIIKIHKEAYGQGSIFKDEEAFFERPQDVCYVPELSDELYTYGSFLELADNNEQRARELFFFCDWQHPDTVVDEWMQDGDWE